MMTLFLPAAPSANPTPGISDLDNTPVAPPGIIDPINKVLGIATFGVLALAVLALILVFGSLVMASMGHGGEALKNLVSNVLKVFFGAMAAASVLSLFTMVTGGF